MRERTGPPADTRDIFQSRLKKLLFSENDNAQIMRAFDIAKEAHGKQKRLSGEPYFEHPLSAAYILLNEAHITDSAIICGALLHDVAEDTDYFMTDEEKTQGINPTRLGYQKYVERVRETLAAKGFSDTTIEIVVSVSKPAAIDKSKDDLIADGVDFFNGHQAYIKKLDLLRHASAAALLVKMADRLHNLRTPYTADSAGRKYDPWPKIRETGMLLRRKKLFLRVASVYPEAYAVLKREISQAAVDLASEYPDLK